MKALCVGHATYDITLPTNEFPVENKKMSKKDKELIAENIEREMKEAAKNLDFERAMELRDILFELKSQ